LFNMHSEQTHEPESEVGGFIPAPAQSKPATAGLAFSPFARGLSQNLQLSVTDDGFANMHKEHVQVPTFEGGFIPAAAQSKPVDAVVEVVVARVVPLIGWKGTEKLKLGRDDTGADVAAFRAESWREVATAGALRTVNEYTGRSATSILSAASFGSIFAFSFCADGCAGIGTGGDVLADDNSGW
jgi:hypothetical protein